MGLKKGQTNNPNGRKKGVRNKRTAKFKDQLNDLFEHHADDMHGWLHEIAHEDPKEAFNVLSKFINYLYPKLATTEHVGDKDNPVINKIIIEHVHSKDSDTK